MVPSVRGSDAGDSPRCRARGSPSPSTAGPEALGALPARRAHAQVCRERPVVLEVVSRSLGLMNKAGLWQGIFTFATTFLGGHPCMFPSVVQSIIDGLLIKLL